MKNNLALALIVIATQAQCAEVQAIGGVGYLKSGAVVGNTSNIGIQASTSANSGLIYGLSVMSASSSTTSYEEQRAEVSAEYRLALSDSIYLDPRIGVGYKQYQKPGNALAPGWYDGDALIGSAGLSLGYRSGRVGLGISVQQIFSNIDVRSDLSKTCSPSCGGISNVVYNYPYFQASDAAASHSLGSYSLVMGTFSFSL